MKKIEAYDENGILIGTYKIHDTADMRTEAQVFKVFTSEAVREKAWAPIESKLDQYDIVGIHLALVGANIQETRLYCKKGQYTYTMAEVSESEAVVARKVVPITPIDGGK